MKKQDKEIKELQIQIESLKADNEKLQKENEFWTNLLKNQLSVSMTAAERIVDEQHKTAVLERALKKSNEKIKALGKACIYCKAESCDAGSHCIEALSNYFIDQAEKELT